MSRNSVKIDMLVMKRLRHYLVRRYDGELYGKISETVSEAVREYLDKYENMKKR